MYIPITGTVVGDASVVIGRRVRQRRVERGWSRIELAARAQVSAETLKAFERTGQISLPRLVRLTVALGLAADWDKIFLPTQPTSLDEVEARGRRPQRGRTSS